LDTERLVLKAGAKPMGLAPPITELASDSRGLVPAVKLKPDAKLEGVGGTLLPMIPVPGEITFP
jgi:hypothetical protein